MKYEIFITRHAIHVYYTEDAEKILNSRSSDAKPSTIKMANIGEMEDNLNLKKMEQLATIQNRKYWRNRREFET